MRRPFIFFAFVLTGIGADLLSKWLVFRALAPRQVYRLIPGVLHIVRAENPGVAFSMLSGHALLISLISLAAMGVVLWLYYRHRRTASVDMLLALGLVLAGAAGNLYDRVRWGRVRDFIDFVPPLPMIGHWAVFNVADICITVGAVAFLIREIMKTHDQPNEQKQSA